VATRSLARLAADYATYVQLLAECPYETMPTAAAVRSQLLALLEPVSKGSQVEGIPPEEIEEARFALVAWADEVLLRRDWSGRSEWQRETLQMHLYRTTRAGNEFFDRLTRLGPGQNAAREIYYLALVCGFEGQYAGQEAERRALIQHQFEMLRAAGVAHDALREGRITPTAYQLEIGRPGTSGWGVLGWLGVMAAGLLLLYGVGWLLLWWLAGDVPLPRGT
jgi:type IV/VI secretion system ImpK/VasF family protein